MNLLSQVDYADRPEIEPESYPGLMQVNFSGLFEMETMSQVESM